MILLSAADPASLGAVFFSGGYITQRVTKLKIDWKCNSSFWKRNLIAGGLVLNSCPWEMFGLTWQTNASLQPANLLSAVSFCNPTTCFETWFTVCISRDGIAVQDFEIHYFPPRHEFQSKPKLQRETFVGETNYDATQEKKHHSTFFPLMLN